MKCQALYIQYLPKGYLVSLLALSSFSACQEVLHLYHRQFATPLCSALAAVGLKGLESTWESLALEGFLDRLLSILSHSNPKKQQVLNYCSQLYPYPAF